MIGSLIIRYRKQNFFSFFFLSKLEGSLNSFELFYVAQSSLFYGRFPRLLVVLIIFNLLSKSSDYAPSVYMFSTPRDRIIMYIYPTSRKWCNL